MSPYRILSIDGGGIRGILSIGLLERLEEAHPGFLKMVDLFAGTSTGGILALGLAAGIPTEQIRELYELRGPVVFADNLLDDIMDLGNLIGAQYSLEPLRNELETIFGGMILAELPKRVLISSFDLDNNPQDPRKVRTWKPKFFHNYPGPKGDGDQRIADVALRTSTAPTYFPIYQGYIDGGVVAGNPAMPALAQALEKSTGSQNLEDIVLLSVGTGHNPRYLTSQNGDWGLAQWASHLVSLMLEGSSDATDYECRQILDSRYMRIQPILPEPIGLDRVDQIPLLNRIAYGYNLHREIRWLGEVFLGYQEG